MYKCSYCLNNFSRRSALNVHQKKCIYKRTPKITTKKPVQPATQASQPISSVSETDLVSVMAQMSANMNKLTEKIEKLEKKPYQINNQINNINNHQNIVITEKLPDCFYSALVNKLGKTKAINLLNLSSASNAAINIYKELYPSNRLKDNPVIYENNTFKYLDGNEVVCDNEIIAEIAKQIQTAMLYASSNLITESIKINKTHQLYDIYDIGKIQNNVRNTGLIERQVSGYIKLELIE